MKLFGLVRTSRISCGKVASFRLRRIAPAILNKACPYYKDVFDITGKLKKLRAMTKCPRCNLEQEESPQCKFCGLVFEAFRESTQASKIAHSKRAVLIAIILVVTGALLAAYFLISYQDKPGEKLTSVERSSDLAQRTNENDLKTTAKELSSDVGILNDLTGGYTKANIIAMVIFSVIGLGYLTYGKKSRQLLMLICGIALMGYSYFVDGIVYIILIGVGLSALPFIVGRK
jgi:hypothetical protein